jgi:predicted P-loop ATPase
MSTGWKSRLLVAPSGAPRALLANAITAMRECPAWHAVLGYDEFARETVVRSAPPWDVKLTRWVQRPWTAHDDLLTAEWLQRQDIAVNSVVAARAVEATAQEASFHPVRNYLEGLEHDGKSRLESWLSEYLGASQTAYHREVGKAMLVAAVARIFEPGCKVDTVPILEGPQGARKSTAVKTLFQPWFSDELADLGSKDAAMQTRGVWGLEVSELDAMSRTEVSRIKSFISRTTDRFRPPYGSRVIESPRSCVFWGSTNADGYLKDETGGRRFLPIKIGKILVERLEGDRDQLWAEAVQLYLENFPWWITNKQVLADAERQQRDRYVGDPWEDVISSFIEPRTEIAIPEILQNALHLEKARWGQTEQNRIARCLRSFGWLRIQVRTGDKREWRYRRPVTSGGDADQEREQISNVTALKLVTTCDR